MIGDRNSCTESLHLFPSNISSLRVMRMHFISVCAFSKTVAITCIIQYKGFCTIVLSFFKLLVLYMYIYIVHVIVYTNLSPSLHSCTLHYVYSECVGHCHYDCALLPHHRGRLVLCLLLLLLFLCQEEAEVCTCTCTCTLKFKSKMIYCTFTCTCTMCISLCTCTCLQ